MLRIDIGGPFHRGRGGLGTHRGDAHARAEPFDAIERELAALWAR